MTNKQIGTLALVMGALAAGADVLKEADMNDVRLKGYVGEAVDRCIRNHVAETDPLYLTEFFHHRTESWMWQSEFWGKWMHSAVPFAAYSGNAELKAKIERGLEDILSTQDEDGYVGNYPEARRYDKECWDVWGTKYTLLGLIYGERLDAAEKLASKLMAHFRDRDLYRSGWYRGMPSCSVLEPIMWLYKRTGKACYLDFAKYVREQMDKEDGARLIRDCDVPVFERLTEGNLFSSLKAYEMMSCYQGLLELYDVTGEKELLDAAVKTADHVIAEEVNLAGGSASGEHWYRGRSRQTDVYNRQNETCVLTTWMRFCEKLFLETGDEKYVDQIERCFYNAYLGSMKPDGSTFAMYVPMAGFRAEGEHHCRTHTNCCNANGPRGFLTFLQTLLTTREDVVMMNLYASGFARVGDVVFQTYTEYPKRGRVEIRYRGEQAREFTFAPRIPGWCEKYEATLNESERVSVPLRRVWQPGDVLELDFDMTVKTHILNDAIAFTRGPVLLARDLRFGGDIGAVIRPSFGSDGSGETSVPDPHDLKLEFRQVRTDDAGIWMAFAADLPTGVHSESPEGMFCETVKFCDFASAGGTWDAKSSYRTWLPLLKFEGHR